MSDQKTKIDSNTGSLSPKRIVMQFIYGLIKAILKAIPTTLIAIVIGAAAGGFLGLAFGPAAPLFAVAGSVMLGLPVAIWEYKIKKGGGSAWDYTE
jgi:ABC-type dipeptide/oligopeptide/nickel transport system permease subunit